jgi:hypothetical protein
VARDGGGWVLVHVAVCQSGAGRQRLRPDVDPAGYSARGSARAASGESWHGADGITTERSGGVCRGAFDFCGSVEAHRANRSHSLGHSRSVCPCLPRFSSDSSDPVWPPAERRGCWSRHWRLPSRSRPAALFLSRVMRSPHWQRAIAFGHCMETHLSEADLDLVLTLS